jgi:two-component system sensor kinase FixL
MTFSGWQDWHGTARVAAAGVLIAIIALVDWRVELNLSFGFLYLVPIILAGTVLARWQIVLVALLCTWLSDLFDPFPFVLAVSLPQDLLVFTSLAGVGLLACQVTRSRHRETEHLRAVEHEMAGRREAQQQLDFLINTSPAAILTMTCEGQILQANPAAYRLFEAPGGALPGRQIDRHIVALSKVLVRTSSSQTFQSEMECRGEREHGEAFLANVFFSTYHTAIGPRLAALVVDASEQLRQREEANLEELLAGSRILVQAVSHEVRNVCSTMMIMYENIVRGKQLGGNKDFEALGVLIHTLAQSAAWELNPSAESPPGRGVDLADVIGDLRIVLDPYCQDAGISIRWEIPRDLPPVLTDRHRLLQVLLNLTKNSQRALEGSDRKEIDVSVSASRDGVSIRVTDSGPGLRSLEHVFQPFQKDAEATGLGLYLSRAFLRSFHGDLRHDPTVPGCSFVIELAGVSAHADDAGRPDVHGTNPAIADR